MKQTSNAVLTTAQLQQAAELSASIDKQTAQLTALLNGTTFTSTKVTTVNGKRVMSPATKARIAAGQKARWAAKNATKATPIAEPAVAPAVA
jgi:hypothetical protein